MEEKPDVDVTIEVNAPEKEPEPKTVETIETKTVETVEKDEKEPA